MVHAPRLALGGRPTVGHLPLEQVIGVRIPASQPNSLALAPSLGWSARLQASARLPARLGSNPSVNPTSLRSLAGRHVFSHIATHLGSTSLASALREWERIPRFATSLRSLPGLRATARLLGRRSGPAFLAAKAARRDSARILSQPTSLRSLARRHVFSHIATHLGSTSRLGSSRMSESLDSQLASLVARSSRHRTPPWAPKRTRISCREGGSARLGSNPSVNPTSLRSLAGRHVFSHIATHLGSTSLASALREWERIPRFATSLRSLPGLRATARLLGRRSGPAFLAAKAARRDSARIPQSSTHVASLVAGRHVFSHIPSRQRLAGSAHEFIRQLDPTDDRWTPAGRWIQGVRGCARGGRIDGRWQVRRYGIGVPLRDRR